MPNAPSSNGSAGVSVSLHSDPIDPFQQLDLWQSQRAANPGELPAATSLFIGRVRGTTAAGLPLDALELEHYPGMTENQLQRLAAACARRHPVAAVMVRHRVGLVLCRDAIVVVAVLADRRGPAQRCCQELLEALKHDAPFWKREWSSGVGEWVLANTPLVEAASS
jgi:molybdopterin synthase catalytic subunit